MYNCELDNPTRSKKHNYSLNTHDMFADFEEERGHIGKLLLLNADYLFWSSISYFQDLFLVVKFTYGPVDRV